LSTQRLKKIEEIFHAALEINPENRAAFLEKHCKDDDGLRKEVSALLTSHEQAGTFLETPNLPLLISDLRDTSDPMLGKQIGAYRIERCIAEGGMGKVYLGIRDDETFKQQVAIKLIKRGMDTAEVLKRFRYERQTLAGLVHPNIARLLDGGSTENGLPYLIMEFIDGIPIDDYCDENKLSTAQRLQLFRIVCSAVHFAHQNLIVHRDLKPGNILVTADGQPKLLDFGIAKLLNQNVTGQTLSLTRTGMQLMSPEYASPEQIRGQTITTASDIYSLGVLLYKLLTGHHPYRFTTHQPSEIEKIICETEPVKPSTVITRIVEITTSDGTKTTLTPKTVSQTRDGKVERLRRNLSGDIDNIIMMALRKEAQRRYASVEQFSEDILRHLHGLPVIAHKDSLGYRSAKFVKRHRTGVSASFLFIILLIVSIIGIAWQAHVADEARLRAEHRFLDVRRLANALLFDIHDAIVNLPGSTPARKLLVTRALEYLDNLSKEASDDQALKLELASAYEKFGSVQGNPTNSNLGDISGAIKSYHKAIDIMEPILKKTPNDKDAHKTLASVYTGLMDVYPSVHRIQEAIEYGEKSSATLNQIIASDSTDDGILQQLSVVYIKIGDISGNPNFPNSGQPEQAMTYYNLSLPILKMLYENAPENLENIRYLGLIYERLASIYEAQQNLQKASEFYEKSMNIRIRFLNYPDHYNLYRDAGIGYEKIGKIRQAEKKYSAALDYYRKALHIFETLLSRDTKNENSRRSVAIEHENIGALFKEQNLFSAALREYEQSAELWQRLAQGDPMNRNARSFWCNSLYETAFNAYKNGQPTLAKKYMKQLLIIEHKLVGVTDPKPDDLNRYAYHLMHTYPAELKNATLALVYARKAAEISNANDPNILDTLAEAYFLNNQIPQAIETEEAALVLVPKNKLSLRSELEANMKRFKDALQQ